MTESVDGVWSVEEALARTSDPRIWDGYQAEKRQQAPRSADLRRSLISELLAKIGTKLLAFAPKRASSEGGWTTLDRAALAEKIVSEAIDEVRLFVPLKAPNAVEHLTNKGLAEAFQQYVLDDAEVAVLQERTGLCHRFEGGRCPLGPSIDYHWPLEAKANDFEFRLTLQDGIFSFGGPDRRPTPQVSVLSRALADRICALRDLLTSGKIQAFGLSVHFVESLVPARLWARKNISIDLANGDLCQEDDRGSFLPLWTGVELRSPTADVGLSSEPAEQAGSTRKRSPKGQEVERIMRDRKIDVEKSGRKAAAAEVMRYMSNPPKSEEAKKALETQVGRISKLIDVER
jgi:hypothetical protein